MRKIKVLKLGWEFPPLINGGLGVACMGISRALSQKVDLNVIVEDVKNGKVLKVKASELLPYPYKRESNYINKKSK